MDNSNKPIFDKAYCDANGIQAEWFKFDKALAEYLCELVEEETDSNGKPALVDGQYLAITIYAILRYFRDGHISPELTDTINHRNMKLGKLAFNHAKDSIETARSRVAENRYNGGLGKPPKNSL